MWELIIASADRRKGDEQCRHDSQRPCSTAHRPQPATLAGSRICIYCLFQFQHLVSRPWSSDVDVRSDEIARLCVSDTCSGLSDRSIFSPRHLLRALGSLLASMIFLCVPKAHTQSLRAESSLVLVKVHPCSALWPSRLRTQPWRLLALLFGRV